MTSLVWMRRDLRLHDHAALATALAEAVPVQPIFIFDTDILARFTNPEDRRLTFLAETLCRLDTQLQKRGGRLLVLHGKATELVPALVHALKAGSVFCAEDFEPATRARDAAVGQALKNTARFVQVLDHLLQPPQQNLKNDGTPYKVFTPFYKVWRGRLGPTELAAYTVKDRGRYADEKEVMAALAHKGLRVMPLDQGPETLLARLGYTYRKETQWRVAHGEAQLQQFVTGPMQHYAKGRDQLAMEGTSRLSPYLRFGLVSIRECARAALEHGGGEKWVSELGWREFYASILYYFPEVVTEEFNLRYRRVIPWTEDKRLIQAFTTGQTGYPIIDAAVRELLTTGFMHNRARMIVASFATKDLLLDWRIGEEFFAQHLMDYELASNNGGWQWAASTGTDASPYFRVFNPTLQSKKFDPKGDYIRRYVPELRALAPTEIHAPWLSPLTKPKDYPMPIIDHATARDRAITVFREAAQ